VFVTSDNPRNEDPLAIIADILEGVEADSLRSEPDRSRAIFEAVGAARADDIVLIAGKGHEDYQEVQGRKLPFSDLEVAQKALEAWA
jgi:UDP-N-acetylmuramoyl-L-alanyl-D-glutamate--2,6-diaminopimelate ligase